MKTFAPGRHLSAIHQVNGSAPDLFCVVADWLDAMQGRTDIDLAFAHLVRAVGADAGCLVRTAAATGRPAVIGLHDRARAGAIRPLDTSYAADCLGDGFRNAAAGTIWSLADDPELHEPGPGSRYPHWRDARGLRDLVVLVLAGSGGTRDHVELHFAAPVDLAVLSTLAALLPTMVRGWAARRVGLVSTLTGRRPATAIPGQIRPVAALSTANPFRLSRAEFRVCLLLSQGHSVASLAEDLGLSEATIRSHLRSIYIKTSTASLAELVFRLLDGSGDALSSRRRHA